MLKPNFIITAIFTAFFAVFAFGVSEVSVFGDQNSAQTPQNPQSQNSAKNAPKKDDLSNIAATNEPDIDDENAQQYELISPNKITLNAKISKKEVYEFEIFSIDFNANSGHELDFDLNLTIESQNIIWLNPKPIFDEPKKGSYRTKLWFYATNAEAKIPKIELTLYRNGEFFQNESIAPRIPTIKTLPKSENFANIVANDLEVKKIKGAKFNEDKNIITLELTAKNAALLAFNLPQNFERQGVEGVKGDYATQSANIFLIAPNDLKSLNFSYFNLAKGEFVNFNLPVKIEQDDISTQVNLNPKESEFEHYRKVSVYGLIIIFLLLFIFKRSYYCLLIAIALIGYAFYINKPFSDATIKANAQITILPTKNSTIFKITDAPQVVKVIAKRGEYTKILLENQSIGWVKNEDIE